MLLNILYCIALWIASPLVIYRSARYGRYRRGVRQKFFGVRSDDFTPPLADPASAGAAPVAWFHAVSVGEVNLVAGLIDAFRKSHPEYQVVVSTATDTGYDLAKSRFVDLPVFFCPLDFTWAVDQTLQTLRPRLLVLAELELWPNLIKHAGQWGCRVAIANGRLSERSAKRYGRFSALLAHTFARIDWIGCQDAEIAERFIACGANANAVAITGSIKFDNAPLNRDTAEISRIARWAAVDPWHQIFIAGSTQSGEEEIALATYRQLSAVHRELRLVIVPRHRERFDQVAALIEAAGFQVRRRSEHHIPAEHWGWDTVILVDTVGELRNWWGISRIAFVGGSFGERGGQNMLEPAGYGSAVSFGPNTQNFRDIARRLLAAGGAVRLNTPDDLTTFVGRCLDEPPAADTLGRQARTVVMSHRGATEKTVEQLGRLLGVDVIHIQSRAA
ncbi:MAG TPA: 3-deoxy-D-manno-octulosonic acid transferase [Planctomycetaceae bacterium]|nr:3-deoxy-D-manno-octulosonic acid transferase [Planctomycetaceae bacterium]